jgi:hypothetical protein
MQYLTLIRIDNAADLILNVLVAGNMLFLWVACKLSSLIENFELFLVFFCHEIFIMIIYISFEYAHIF